MLFRLLAGAGGIIVGVLLLFYQMQALVIFDALFRMPEGERLRVINSLECFRVREERTPRHEPDERPHEIEIIGILPRDDEPPEQAPEEPAQEPPAREQPAPEPSPQKPSEPATEPADEPLPSPPPDARERDIRIIDVPTDDDGPTREQPAVPSDEPPVPSDEPGQSEPQPQPGLDSRERVPIFRVTPHYPPRALERGIEGYVLVEFTVSAGGEVLDPVKILEAVPKGYFERASERAIRRFKYKPTIVNGVAVADPGVRARFIYKLNK